MLKLLESPKYLAAIALILVISLYGVASLGLRLFQRHLIFRPTAALSTLPEDVQLSAQEVWIEVPGSAEGDRLHGWWIPAATPETPVVLYLHGNGGNVSNTLDRAKAYHQAGWSVLTVDYRGYGRSTPRFPSEEQVYVDAAAAWQYLVEDRGISPDRIVIYGHSLGGAIAIELATQQPEAGALVVDCSFTSVADVAGREPLYGLFPLRWLVVDDFNSLAKVPNLKMPVLFIHGTEDTVIPPDMSRTLYEAAPQPKRLYFVEGAGHFNFVQVAPQEYVQVLSSFVEDAIARPSVSP